MEVTNEIVKLFLHCSNPLTVLSSPLRFCSMGFKGEGKGKGNGGGTGAAKSDLERALALSRQDQGSHVSEDDMLKRVPLSS
mmetsp:Transcript_7263/g.11477  ORF Transcript_7263/g.11477 Transcript_7263/m.11477 type:complete len:81 (-) Transcript_7263:1138-1380(-)